MRIESLQGLLSQFPDIDGFWNFEDLSETENKVRDQIKLETVEGTPRLVELLSQLARVQGLAGKLSDAGATLLSANDILTKLNTAEAERARVRLLIEQGRFFGLSMNPPQSISYFSKAYEGALKLNESFFSIEAALMMSISQSPKYRNDWLQGALKIAEDSKDANGSLWLPQLYLMSGWHSFDFRKYDEALVSFEKALEKPELLKDLAKTQSTKWAIGRTLRALGRIQDDLEIQQELLTQLSSAGKVNGYVFLEIGECLQLLKKPNEAKENFELAYKELSLNGWYSDNKSSELSRIQHLYKKK